MQGIYYHIITTVTKQLLNKQLLNPFSKKQNWTGKAQGWYDEVYDFDAFFVDGWQPR